VNPSSPVYAPLTRLHVRNILGFRYELYRACANEQPFLNDIDFTNVLPLCFPIAGSKEVWNLTEDVSVSFQARLSAAPTAKYAVVMISFTDALME
jgi:hypothetical protein